MRSCKNIFHVVKFLEDVHVFLNQYRDSSKFVFRLYMFAHNYTDSLLVDVPMF